MGKSGQFKSGLQGRPCCTTTEAARSLGVSVRTIQLWVDSGALQAWKTVGGHRRIPIKSLERLRKSVVPGLEGVG